MGIVKIPDGVVADSASSQALIQQRVRHIDGVDR
jgi:hypothetical protein